ncbi:MAG TPA: tripartite tricarboxylate transporter substrate binding protein [Ramlibacter sp.]|nr:tripartite tricarboxylate transporter substrate binding protein [Ramlibacter sp.]
MKFSPLRRQVVCGGALLPLAAAHAQSYPVRPITFIYGYAAGSSSDAAWRAIVLEASRRLGQPIVFENRPGANGRLGLDATLRAKPDGYTIGGFNNAQLVVAPLIDPKLALEPGRQFAPILVGVETYLLMVARPGLPFKDIAGLVAYAKANPGKLNAGSPGPGTGSHLALAMVATQAGIDWTTVHYKGAAPSVNGLLSGEIDVMFTDLLAKPHIDAGKMVGIGVSGAQRWNLFPTLPTFREAGYQGVVSSSWQGVLAPPGVPEDILASLNRAFNEALASPELRAKLEPAGWIIRGGTPQEATALVRSDTEAYRPVVKAANIKTE